MEDKTKKEQIVNSSLQSEYRLPLPLRIVVIILVLFAAILTTLGVLPLAKLLQVDPSHLQGAGFRPTFGTMFIGILYSASQFILIWLVMRFIHKRKFGSLGFKKPFWKPILLGTTFGIGLYVAEFGLDCLIGRNVQLSWNVPSGVPAISVIGYFALWFLFLLTLNSLKEELVFRAYPIEQFNDKPGAMIWILIFVSLIFAAVHHVLEPFSISAFLSRFSIALVLAYAYFRWHSIWLVVGIHNGANFMGFLLRGHWKSGGLFKLTFDAPSPETIIIVDFLAKIIGLTLLHLYWLKSKNKITQ
ncbi:MAG: CPBP family intramembrane metalloprotease [Candidatus Cloacimonetes bacterium]|nr:CPBP family intramembrane metalloprotease [Candidatus Cloacimonadota bacterium]MBS3768073.1 CPBP family intramembrane metalloprotease [Candidatus Cloacimonadota bacterium]